MDRVSRAAIALGSNVGDRPGHLAYAVSRLADYFTGLTVSRSVATVPVNVPGDQPEFLNAAAVGETLEQKRFFEQALAGRTDLLGRRAEQLGPAHGEVLPSRWIE